MIRRVLSLMTLVGAVATCFAAAETVPGRISVKFRNYSFQSNNFRLASAIPAAVNELGGMITHSNGVTGWHEIQVPAGTSVSTYLAKIKARPDVVNASPVYIWKAFDINPNDPLYNGASVNGKFIKQYAPQLVDAPYVWGLGGGQGSTITIIDTGVDIPHEDFIAINGSSRISAGWNVVAGNNMPQDDQGHGTHCMGIAAATGNNGKGVAGIAWRANLVAMKVLDSSGSGTSTNIAEGITRATNNGYNHSVLSMSLGGPGDDPATDDAINNAFSNGNIIVAAAGNNGDTVKNYPGAANNVLCVGSTTSSDQISVFSTYGPWVHVGAPGSQIASTYWVSGQTNSYAYDSGTSMATPLVAGSAALLWSIFPDASNRDIVDAIKKGSLYKPVLPVGSRPFKYERFNFDGALAYLIGEVNNAPGNYDVVYGTNVGGDASSVALNDGVTYDSVSEQTRIGETVMNAFSLSAARTPSRILVPVVKVAITTDQRATTQIWLWDWVANRYSIFRGFITDGGGVQTVKAYDFYDKTRWLSPNGDMKGYIRTNVAGRRSTGGLKVSVDQLSLGARLIRANAP